MRGAMMYGPGEVRVEERDEPRLVEATDAIIRVSAACVCGSDLWPYRGIEELAWPAPMGHRKSLRPRAAAGRRCSRLRGDGRTARDQGASAPVSARDHTEERTEG